MKFYLLLLFIINLNLYSKEINLKGIRYFDSNTSEFSENSNFTLSNDIIKSITKNRVDGITFYALPTFCDIGVTLATDSLGGANTVTGISVAMNSYLNHGFSHIYSINNPPYLSKHINKKKKYPFVVFSQKSILFSTSEYNNLPEEIYKVVKNEDEALKEIQTQIDSKVPIIYILNRYYQNEGYYFESEFFRKITRLNYDKSSIFVSSFGDKTGTLDSIRSGITFIQHPISLEISKVISNEILEKIKYIPELNVYRNLYLEKNREEITNEIDELTTYSKYFKKYYYNEVNEKIKSLNPETQGYLKIKSEYKSYEEFIKKNQYLIKNLIISGGSGNLFSFPGISAIREYMILYNLTENPKLLINSLTKNSCYLFVDNYNGVIQEGSKANFLLYRDNPLKTPWGIFNFNKMYINGELVNLDQNMEKEFKKNKK